MITVSTIFYIITSHSPTGTGVYIMNRYFLSSDFYISNTKTGTIQNLKWYKSKVNILKILHNYLSNYILCKLVCWM